MNEVKCPNCNTLFSLDENTYSSIKIQVRDKEFEEEVEKRIKNNLELEKKILGKKLDDIQKDNEINKLSIENKYKEQINELENTITKLNSQISNFELNNKNNIQIEKMNIEKIYKEETSNLQNTILKLESKISSLEENSRKNIFFKKRSWNFTCIF